MANHARDASDRLDQTVLNYGAPGLESDLPEGEVVEVVELGLSDWCETHRIVVRLLDGSTQRFFTKTASGSGGLEQVQAHWHSESSLYRFIPEFIPKPIAFDTYASKSDTHFLLMEFVDMIDDDIPEQEAYMAPPIALHLRSLGKSPTGKFGFGVNTRFGNMSQSNDWEESWQVWWIKHMKMIVAREEGIRGAHSPENKMLTDDFLNIVLPRYLSPLETGGRSIEPCLCHTDMWPGNVKYKLDNESVIIYDANALWAHNEVELSPFRNPRYPLGKPYIKEYHKYFPVSEPEEDADDRLIMYLVRHQVCLASLYPNETKLRDIFLSNMRYLVNKVKQEEVGRETLSTFGKVQSFGQGHGTLERTGTGEAAQALGADLGTVVN